MKRQERLAKDIKKMVASVDSLMSGINELVQEADAITCVNTSDDLNWAHAKLGEARDGIEHRSVMPLS